MFTTIIGILSSGAAVAIFGWAFQTSSRISKIEQKQEDLPTLINSQFADVGRRLERIERAMNGSLKGHE